MNLLGFVFALYIYRGKNEELRMTRIKWEEAFILGQPNQALESNYFVKSLLFGACAILKILARLRGDNGNKSDSLWSSFMKGSC